MSNRGNTCNAKGTYVNENRNERPRIHQSIMSQVTSYKHVHALIVA